MSNCAPEYDDCPEVCRHHERREPDGFCARCPVGDSWRAARDGARAEIETRAPSVLHSYSIETLLDDAAHALALRRPRTAIERVVAQIVAQERAKMRRVDEWNHEVSDGRSSMANPNRRER